MVACVISAGSVPMRHAFDIGAKAFLEIQSHMFVACFLRAVAEIIKRICWLFHLHEVDKHGAGPAR